MGGEAEYANIHGRKWGRGLRPWFLLPKILCVGAFLGGLASALTLMVSQQPGSGAEWRSLVSSLASLFHFVVIPFGTAAVVFGGALTTTHWRAFIRMRWFLVKVATVIVAMPLAHLVMRGRLIDLTSAAQTDDPRLAGMLAGLARGTATILAVVLLVVILGRLKPRLGQNYAKTFSAQNPGRTSGRPA